MSEGEKLEVVLSDAEAKDVQDEVAVRLASLVFVWDGTKGVFFEPGVYVNLKKKFPCEDKEVKGVVVAALTEHLKQLKQEVNFDEIYKQRMVKDSGMRAFYEPIAMFRRHDQKTVRDILTTSYLRGKFVEALSKEPGKYGNQTVKKFAEEMKISESTAYLYQRFAAQYQTPRVLELASKEMPWSSVVNLLSLKAEKERAKLEDQYLAGKLDEKTLAVAVKKAKRAETVRREATGEKVDRRGGPGMSRLFDSMKALSDELLKKLAEFSEGRKAFYKLPDGERKQALKAHLKAADSGLVNIHKKLSKMIGSAEKSKEADKSSAG